MIDVRLECSDSWTNRASYTLTTLLSILDLSWREGDGKIVISYGLSNPRAEQGKLLIKIPHLVNKTNRF